MTSPKTKIIIASDFDLTASAEFMQEALFRKLGYSMDDYLTGMSQISRDKVEEVLDEDALDPRLMSPSRIQRAGYCEELAWLHCFIDFSKNCGPGGKPWKLTQCQLREVAQGIKLFPGLPDAVEELKEEVKIHRKNTFGAELQYHVITAGLYDLVVGSKLGKHCDGIFGTELMYHPRTREIMDVAFPVTSTTKTRFLYNIMKGAGVPVNKDVDDATRIPANNFIVLDDGQSGKPMWAEIKNHSKGRCIVVYDKNARPYGKNQHLFNDYNNALTIFNAGRVHNMEEADYRPDSGLRRTLSSDIDEIMERISDQRT